MDCVFFYTPCRTFNSCCELKLLNVFHQEDLQMIVKGVKHQLTGMVSLGGFYNNMKKIKTRKATYSIVLHRN